MYNFENIKKLKIDKTFLLDIHINSKFLVNLPSSLKYLYLTDVTIFNIKNNILKIFTECSDDLEDEYSEESNILSIPPKQLHSYEKLIIYKKFKNKNLKEIVKNFIIPYSLKCLNINKCIFNTEIIFGKKQNSHNNTRKVYPNDTHHTHPSYKVLIEHLWTF